MFGCCVGLSIVDSAWSRLRTRAPSGASRVTTNGPLVVLEHRIVGSREVAGQIFDRRDAGADGPFEVLDCSIPPERRVVDDAVKVALLVELVGRHADRFGALLPREVVLPNDVRQAARLDRVEHPVDH